MSKSWSYIDNFDGDTLGGAKCFVTGLPLARVSKSSNVKEKDVETFAVRLKYVDTERGFVDLSPGAIMTIARGAIGMISQDEYSSMKELNKKNSRVIESLSAQLTEMRGIVDATTIYNAVLLDQLDELKRNAGKEAGS